MAENFVNAVERAGLSGEAGERELFHSLDMMCRLFILKSLSEWTDWYVTPTSYQHPI
jgi:hypothetical protein